MFDEIRKKVTEDLTKETVQEILLFVLDKIEDISAEISSFNDIAIDKNLNESKDFFND